MDKRSLILLGLVAVLALALGAVVVYKAWPLLHPEIAQVAPLDPSCDLRRGPCTSSLPNRPARIRFAVEPRSLPAAQPLRLSVSIEGVDASEVAVDFAGVDMNMGFNRATLEQVAPGRFEGGGMLPVCVRSRMTWEARVLARTADGLVAAPFRFDTVSASALPAD